MTITRSCAACGTTQNLAGSFGGVLLCRDHYEDIRAQVDQLRASGKQVNVAGIARRMFREQFGAETYALRDVPSELWQRAKDRAYQDGISLRELILAAMAEYLDRKP